MRIGILGQFTDPDDPNVSKAGYHHVRGLASLLSRTHEVTLYPFHRRRLYFTLPGSRVVPLSASNPLKRWMVLVLELIRKRKRYDLFIVHNPTIFSLPIVFLQPFLRFPVVVDYVDRQTSVTYSKYRILRFLGFFSEILFLSCVSNWITDSISLEGRIKKYRKSSNVMVCRIALSGDETGAVKKKYMTLLSSKTVKIAYTGALVYDHGVDILLEAFAELPPENLYLLITGSGPLKSNLQNTVKDLNISNVNITFLDDNVMEDFLDQMNILVIPYRDTATMRKVGFPSKLLFYLRAGKAIIATRVGEIDDILINGNNAVIIEPGNKGELKAAMQNLILDEKKRSEIGKNSQLYFQQNFSFQAVQSKLNCFLSDIIK